jgi:Arc/MetJ-type ribon-helix-helix transcriptional regulator
MGGLPRQRHGAVVPLLPRSEVQRELEEAGRRVPRSAVGINWQLANPDHQRYFSAMTVALDQDVEDFLQDQVRSGVCADASALINDVIRSLRDQQRKPFDVTPELETWLLTAADQPVTPLTKADFNAILKVP